MGKKFWPKREYVKGESTVQAGFRDGEIVFRVQPKQSNIQVANFTYDELLDLADALDAALDEQERDPLL